MRGLGASALRVVALVVLSLAVLSCGGGASSAPPRPPVISVTVTPNGLTLTTEATAQFTATVTGTSNAGVSWSVNGVAGGNSTLGTISATGLYTAPGVPPEPNQVTIRATSAADSTRSGTSSVSVVNPAPTLSSISPQQVDAGSSDTTLTVLGSGFARQSTVEFAGGALDTTFTSSTQLDAVIPATELALAGEYPVTVMNPAPGGGTTGASQLTVLLVVTLTPSSPTLDVAVTQQFVATVTGSVDAGVSWFVDDIPGGDNTVGIIASDGLYTAPAVPPTPNEVTVTATSVADPARSASAAVTIVNPAPTLTSVTPAAVNAGSGDTSLALLGQGFTPQSAVHLSGADVVTTFGSSTELHADVPAAQLADATTLNVTVTTPAPGGGTSNSLELSVLIVVTVAPSAQTLRVNETRQFAATVVGSSDTGVSWTVNNIAGGNATVGAIDPGGLYTAPAIPPAPNQVTITAASLADPARKATASVTIVNPVPLLSSVTPASVNAGSPTTALTVTGADFTPQSSVHLGGATLTTTFESPAQITAMLPAARMATAGSYPLTVVTPTPGGGTSNSVQFAVLLMVVVSPSTQTLEVTETRQFTAAITGSPDQNVTWTVNDIPGGDVLVGTISATGLYTAPGVPPVPYQVTLTATSAADPSRSDSAAITIVNPVPVLQSMAPDTLDAGSPQTTLLLTGSSFTPQSTVEFDGLPLATTFDSATQLTAILPAAQLTSAGSFPVRVITPSPGGGTSNSLDLTVLVAVSVTPTMPTLFVAQTRQFTATVIGSANQAVNWTVNDIAGGDTTVGVIDASGLYTAPAVPPVPNQVTVTATSVADPARSASAAVTIINPLPVLSSISPNSIFAGSPATLLTVSGSGFTPQSMVQLGAIGLATTYDSSNQLTAIVPADRLTTSGSFPVTVVTPTPGGGTSNARTLSIEWTVGVTPETQILSLHQTKHFSAVVADSADQTVLWFVNDIAGGDDTVGTIPGSGIYIAPGAVPVPETVTVKAVSVSEPAKFGLASVTVTLPDSDNYPRADAGDIHHPSTPLPQISFAGALVAVLDWTAKDESGTEEDVFAICHSLNPWAIAHIHTSDLAEAVTYPIVAVAGVLNVPSRLSGTERQALVDFVDQGGTLLLWEPSDSTLLNDFGIGPAVSQPMDFTRPISFDLSSGDPTLSYIDAPEEVDWQLTYPDYASTRGYADPVVGWALAHWQDGSVALARSDLGLGRAYVFGWRLRHVLTDGERQHIPGPEPQWTNTLNLDADICRLLARGIYEGRAGVQVRAGQFASGGKPAALILTHDIDARTSYARTPEFAQYEHDRGLVATYNFTTAPYSGGWTGTLYDVDGRLSIQQAIDLGQNIASHSFGHFPDFYDAPLGTGNETAANYFPEYSWDLSATIGMSVLGEMGVSRWLLEQDFGLTVDIYRSGELLVPDDHLQGLIETGYRRDSSYAAGLTRGNIPFVASTMSSGNITTYSIVEFPVTLSDEDLTDENLEAFLDVWENVIRVNYANNAPTVLLIHPVEAGPRLEALEGILDRVADLDLWIGDLKTFADAWEAPGLTCSRWP
jgi:hypothetical protein